MVPAASSAVSLILEGIMSFLLIVPALLCNEDPDFFQERNARAWLEIPLTRNYCPCRGRNCHYSFQFLSDGRISLPAGNRNRCDRSLSRCFGLQVPLRHLENWERDSHGRSKSGNKVSPQNFDEGPKSEKSIKTAFAKLTLRGCFDQFYLVMTRK